MGGQPLSAAAHLTPQDRLARTVALVLAGNQPFYPLYLWWLLPAPSPWLASTAAAMPLFISVWWLAPRHGFAARLLLSAGGSLHTLACIWLLGTASGVQCLLLPCLTLTGLLFTPAERGWMVSLMLPPLIGLIVIEPGTAAASGLLPPDGSAVLFRLNIASAGMLTAFLGTLVAWRGQTGKPTKR